MVLIFFLLLGEFNNWKHRNVYVLPLESKNEIKVFVFWVRGRVMGPGVT